MTSLKLINNKKEFIIFIFTILIIFIFNILSIYNNFLTFTQNPSYATKAYVLNKYDKDDYFIYKFKSTNFSFFTSTPKSINLNKLDYVDISLVSRDITFFDFFKNAYLKSFNIFKIENNSLKKEIFEKISAQHTNSDMKELFQALFLAIPTNTQLRDVFAIYSISHLIAISGFHLSVLSFVIFTIIYYPYNFFHNRYFPYRNKKFDILIFTLLLLFVYLIFTDLVPSLLRAFIMLTFGLFMLRANIKILSFQTLLFTLLLILAIFPNYIFSLSLWFSIIGVFYIFLFLNYFKDLPKWFLFIFFNIWIFASFNPIVHYFFPVSSYIQLLSPIVTLLFTIFYPFELFLHFIGFGSFLDEYLLYFINIKFSTFDIYTPSWFFILYIFLSLGSIFSKYAFYFLNFFLVSYNIYLYL